MIEIVHMKVFRRGDRIFPISSIWVRALCILTTLFLAMTLSAPASQERSELAEFRQNIIAAQGSLKIGYLVHIQLLQNPENAKFIRQAVGRYFYEGARGYLAHLDIDRVMRLMLNDIPFQILDKKKLDDKREHWYFVTAQSHDKIEAVKARFEPIFAGMKTLVIRIRPEDTAVLGKLGAVWSLIEEILWEPLPKRGRLELPYLSQMANKINPNGTCQNTCLAMFLRYYGWKGTPDDITREWGSKVAQTPEGGARVFNAYAEKFGLAIRAEGKRAPYAEFRAALKKGHPLTVHGYFTAGHVLIVNSCDDAVYDCHDPAGRWNQVPKGTYDSTVSGRHQKYRIKPFDQAVAPDGNVWWIEYQPVVFEEPAVMEGEHS